MYNFLLPFLSSNEVSQDCRYYQLEEVKGRNMKKTLALLGCTAGIFSFALNARDYAPEIRAEAAQAQEDIKDAGHHLKEAGHYVKEAVKDTAHDVATAAEEKVETAKTVVREAANDDVQRYDFDYIDIDSQNILRLAAVIPGLEEGRKHILVNAHYQYHNGVLTIVADKIAY